MVTFFLVELISIEYDACCNIITMLSRYGMIRFNTHNVILSIPYIYITLHSHGIYHIKCYRKEVELRFVHGRRLAAWQQWITYICTYIVTDYDVYNIVGWMLSTNKTSIIAM